MNEPEIPSVNDLLYPTLIALDRLGGSARRSEVMRGVVDVAEITEEQLEVVFPSGSTRAGDSKVEDRIGWALSFLKKAEAVSNTSQRGVWSLTSDGRAYLAMAPQAGELAVQRDVKDRLDEERTQRGRSSGNEIAEGQDEETWKETLLGLLRAIEPAAFERLAQRLLREAGFVNLEVTGASGDGGIDGLGVYKPSLVSFPIYFQCKRYAGSVGAGVIRDFRGAMAGRGEKGLVITTGTFSQDARREATRDGAPPIDLIDGEELCDLLKEYGLGVSVTERVVEDVTVQPEFFEAI